MIDRMDSISIIDLIRWGHIPAVHIMNVPKLVAHLRHCLWLRRLENVALFTRMRTTLTGKSFWPSKWASDGL